MKKLLLLLGWAVIGQGMWYCKGGVKNDKHAAWMKSSLARFSNNIDELLYVISHYISERYQAELYQKRLLDAQPKDIIKFSLNDADIPNCHHPHQIVHTHMQRVESITDFIFCAQDCRVHIVPTFRDIIKVSLITCATEQICQKYFKYRGCVKKFEHQLFIVPPQIEHKFVSCVIECPVDQTFNLEKIDYAEFMKRFEQEPEIPESDSSDIDFLIET